MTNATKPIYEVPVYFFHTLGKTSEGETLQGTSSEKIFSESNFGKLGARLKLRLSPAFYKNYNKLSVEERKKWNPFKFRKGKIERALDCVQRHISKQEKYICGPPTTEDEYDENSHNGYFGGCVLHGYDNDDLSFCPYRIKKEMDSFRRTHSVFIENASEKANKIKENYIQEISNKLKEIKNEKNKSLKKILNESIKLYKKDLKELERIYE